MSDDSGLEPIDPLIDVRSPAERWAESGRAGFERARNRLEHQRGDVVALVWMVFVVAIVGSEIYSALRFGDTQGFPGTADWWLRFEVLSSTGGSLALFGSVVGIALAVMFAGRTSLLALRLALLVGAWAAVAGVLGVVVNFHDGGGFTPRRSFDGSVADAMLYLGYAGLGLVVAIVAWRCSLSDQGSDGLS